MNNKHLFMLSLCLTLGGISFAQKKETKKESTKPEAAKPALQNAATFSALKFRNLGPAIVSGRIADIAVNPFNKSEYYLAVASGGIWKTSNNGTTYEPIFDGEGSYSMSCIRIDPANPNVIWAGTGENNNQRSVAYGDGVYKSEDGGKSWKNVGLQKSEHIGNISIDPVNSSIVYVAAYGPLWSSGGERGIYKTTDGGKTWKQLLNVSENTGFSEVHIDPKHPEILYACAHQRRRHEWTYISGGPESGLYKSTDAGATWNKLSNGLPSGDVGRIGLAISPVNTDIVYAIVEGTADGKGFYKSSDRGASWEKQSSWSTAGNYYQEIVADPKNEQKVYSLDTWAQLTTDGGKTFSGVGEKNKHVDNHALYIEPENTAHLMMGCDGGLYESWDGAQTWQYKSNLPVTQFYRVAVDNTLPFYFIYGGTQDNNSMGGPSRTISASGITNADWYITCGGDGFESQVDPKDPNIVYSESQYGGLIRFDKKTGEVLDIRPQEKDGEPAYRWNWDAPLFVSEHLDTRIYFAANKLFKSDDRGNTWKTISPDLTRQLDRNKLPVMGKVWSMDAVAKNASTTIYGNITAFYESPKNEKLLFAGTDDGLIQVTSNGGESWNKVDNVAGIPERTLVQNLLASQHDENVAYAIFNNHRNGDFKPYVLKSSDKGKTWASMSSNLPASGAAYCIAEDHKNPDLLFVGTEFGVYFTLDGGKSWTALKGGLPTICIRDIAIQERENDLVLASFGRGFYVLDNYAILQTIKKEDLDKPANIFPVKDGLVFVPSVPLGHKGKSFQGASYYTAENPPIGAQITYYLKDDYKTIKEKRKETEKEKIKNNQPVYYPTADSLRLEDREEAPYVLLTISDANGTIIRKLKQAAKKGMYRVTWDGRSTKTSPVSFYTPNPDNPYEDEDKGPMSIPGKYFASLSLVKDGKNEMLTDKVAFNLVSMNSSSISMSDKTALESFYADLSEFRKNVLATENYNGEMQNRIKFIKAGLIQAPGNSMELMKETKNIEAQLLETEEAFSGDKSLSKREFETLPGLSATVEGMVSGLWSTTALQTKTYEEALGNAKVKFANLYNKVKTVQQQLTELEKKLDASGVPYTPGRLPALHQK